MIPTAVDKLTAIVQSIKDKIYGLVDGPDKRALMFSPCGLCQVNIIS